MLVLRAEIRVLLLIALVAWISGSGFAQTEKAGGSVEGEVFVAAAKGASEAKGVERASVLLFRSSVDGPVEAGLAGRARTDSLGGFVISDLKPGPYMVCVQARDKQLLNPCDWGTYQVVRVEEGRTVQGIKVELERGVLVNVRVEDPEGLVSFRSKDKKGTPASVVIGAWGDGNSFHRAQFVSSGLSGHNYRLTLRADKDFRLTVEGLGVNVLDHDGRNVSSTPPPVVNNSVDQAPTTLNYRLAPTPK